MTVYKITFETVNQDSLVKYCNADPRFFKNVTQTVPNSEIPDEDWHTVETTTEDPWDQHNQLVVWDMQDKEFVRNIQLYEQVREPEWRKL